MPLSARIIAIADVYDALRSKSLQGLGRTKAVSIIVEGDGRTMPDISTPMYSRGWYAADLGSLFESNPDQLD